MRKMWFAGAGVLALALVMFAGAPGVAAQAKSSRPTIALLDFDFGTVQQWWSGNWDIGKGISDLIVDELVNDGSFRVIERKRLDAILAEQNFSNSERADPSAATVAKLGKVLGVKYLIVGSITKFGMEQKKQGIGGGGFGGGGFGLGVDRPPEGQGECRHHRAHHRHQHRRDHGQRQRRWRHRRAAACCLVAAAVAAAAAVLAESR